MNIKNAKQVVQQSTTFIVAVHFVIMFREQCHGSTVGGEMCHFGQ